MSQLEPNTSYVYEKADGVTYARKTGDPPDKRFEIGRDHDPGKLLKELQHARLWGEIHRAAEANPALQDALERVIVLYELQKQDQSIPHHPV